MNLLEGQGVEGDAHCGKQVKHRSRVAQNPNQPNLRQVHLIQQELFDELFQKGFEISPGELGENITTNGIDLLGLPRHTILEIGQGVQIQITGLRNPCHQLDDLHKGLMKALLDRDADGGLVRKAGIMAIVLKGGTIGIGDDIKILMPAEPYEKLERV